MKIFYLIFTLSLLISNLHGQNQKVIIDADTGNEIDDTPAIVLALKSGNVDILGVTAAQWNRIEVCGRQTMHESWVLNNRILQLLQMDQIPSLKGSENAVGQGEHWGSKKGIALNEASEFIIRKALEMPENEKLIVIVTGSATNVSSAIISEPKIIDKIAVYFIGTTYNFERKAFSKNEFNVRSDLNAVDVLFDTENLELHVMPANICTDLKVTQNDIDSRLKSDEGIEGMLKELWNKVNKDGIDWTMWDFAIVQAVLNPQWAKQELRNTPHENTPRNIYVYTEIDSKAIMNDFWKVFLK
jgi:inosine-uridine nucleoside N-ribohydrolase